MNEYLQRFESIKERIEEVKTKEELQGLENVLTIHKLNVERGYIRGEISIDEKKKLRQEINEIEKTLKHKTKNFQHALVQRKSTPKINIPSGPYELLKEIEKKLMESDNDTIVFPRGYIRKLEKKYGKKLSVFDFMNPAKKADYSYIITVRRKYIATRDLSVVEYYKDCGKCVQIYQLSGKDFTKLK